MYVSLIFENVFVADCSIFTVYFTEKTKLPLENMHKEIDTIVREGCLAAGLGVEGYFHVVYRPGWEDCYLFNICSTCTPISDGKHDTYDFVCNSTALTTGLYRQILLYLPNILYIFRRKEELSKPEIEKLTV